MKIWTAFGTEHSMNLVIIGRFKAIRDATNAKEIIDRLIAEVAKHPDAHDFDQPPEKSRFSDEMFALLSASKLFTIGSAELSQFAYEAEVQAQGNDVVITTEESEVSAFLKVLIEKGARVEMYSAHDYPDTEHGRGK